MPDSETREAAMQQSQCPSAGNLSATALMKKGNKIPRDGAAEAYPSPNENSSTAWPQTAGGDKSRRERQQRRHDGRQAAKAMAGQYMQSGSNPNKELKQKIKAWLAEVRLRESDKATIKECEQELRAAVAKLGPKWSVELFGSVANGFPTRSSDVDATCVGADEDGQEVVPATLLAERLTPILQENPKFSIQSSRLGASVPILKLTFNECLDVDLSVNNTQAIQNTKLLKAYSDLDDRVRDLGLLVKRWAKEAGVCGAIQGHLSSYTFTIMVIYFMQVHHDVGLPFLATKVCELDEAVKHAREMFKCTKQTPELLKLFFQFYAREFDWGSEVVSIRWGRRMDVREVVLKHLRGIQQNRIHIEDPYKLERNLHCVLGDQEEEKLKWAFEAMYNNLNYPSAGLERKSRRNTDPTVGDLGAFTGPMPWMTDQAALPFLFPQVMGHQQRQAHSPESQSPMTTSPVLAVQESPRAIETPQLGASEDATLLDDLKDRSGSDVTATTARGASCSSGSATETETEEKQQPRAAVRPARSTEACSATVYPIKSGCSMRILAEMKKVLQPSPEAVPTIVYQ